MQVNVEQAIALEDEFDAERSRVSGLPHAC